jgi:hypothetical protein
LGSVALTTNPTAAMVNIVVNVGPSSANALITRPARPSWAVMARMRRALSQVSRAQSRSLLNPAVMLLTVIDDAPLGDQHVEARRC